MCTVVTMDGDVFQVEIEQRPEERTLREVDSGKTYLVKLNDPGEDYVSIYEGDTLLGHAGDTGVYRYNRLIAELTLGVNVSGQEPDTKHIILVVMGEENRSDRAYVAALYCLLRATPPEDPS